jgi:hypothetical protein
MTEVTKKKNEEMNKNKQDDSRKGYDSSTIGISKSAIDRTSEGPTGYRRSSMPTSNKGIKRVSFQKNIVDTVLVESFKKFNSDISCEEHTPSKAETIKCKCLIY